MSIYTFHIAHVLALKWDKTSINILAEYTDYVDILLFNLVIELPKNIEINKYVIELIDSKQAFYWPIYALSSVELETLKIYIKTYLRTEFIQPSKSPIGASILFDKKTNGNFYLFVNYQSLKNLTMKNQYPLSLISISLDWFSQIK